MAIRLHHDQLLPALLAVALAAGLVPLAKAAFRVQEAELFEIRYLPSSRPLRALSRPLQLTVADYYWMQTVQYIGDNAARREGLPLVLPLVDLITDLDPDHGYAYQSAGLVLSSVLRLDESDAILKKGIERGPNWWSYSFYLAFNDFYYRGDYASAARWAEQSARTPGASPRIAALALALQVKSGAPDHAVRMIDEMLASVTDEKLRANLKEQHKLAMLQRDFAALDATVARFKEARGRPPGHLEELVAAGLLARLPTEPYGGAYIWRDGAVHSTGRDYRLPPPDPGLLQRRPPNVKAP
jgi:tetratricopeptide (TPR) repeat protein